MEKIPDTYYVRYEECNKARGNYHVDRHETQLLKAAIEKEEEVIKTLPRYVPGVFYQGFTFEKNRLRSPQDIEIDEEDNLYVADGGFPRMIQKISNKSVIIYEKKYNRLSKGQVDIERDNDGNLFVFARRTLSKRTTENNIYVTIPKAGSDDVFPFQDMHIAIGQRNTLFLIKTITPFVNTPVIYSYDFKGNLLCKREIKGENVKPGEGYIQLIDLTTDSKGNVLLVYSYLNPYWDKVKDGYLYRNGILKFEQNCNQIYNRALALDGKVTSITTTPDDSIIISDKHCFYVYDKNLNPLFKYDLSNRELGKISIRRIKADLRGQWLYIIESKYSRILKYDLQNKKLYEKGKE